MRIVAKRIQAEWFAKPTVMIVFVDVHEKTIAEIARIGRHVKTCKRLTNSQHSERWPVGLPTKSTTRIKWFCPIPNFWSHASWLWARFWGELPEEVAEKTLWWGSLWKKSPRRMTKSFGNIRGGSRRIKAIVSELKDYVRQKDYELKPVDINKVIYSAQTLTSHLGKKQNGSVWLDCGNGSVCVGQFSETRTSVCEHTCKCIWIAHWQKPESNDSILQRGSACGRNHWRWRGRNTRRIDSTSYRSIFYNETAKWGYWNGVGGVVSNILKEHNARIVFGKSTPARNHGDDNLRLSRKKPRLLDVIMFSNNFPLSIKSARKWPL